MTVRPAGPILPFVRAGLLFFVVAACAAFAAGEQPAAPEASSDSTSLVHEAPASSSPAPKRPAPRRATLDLEIAVPQAGAGVPVRRPTPVPSTDSRTLPRVGAAAFTSGIPAELPADGPAVTPIATSRPAMTTTAGAKPEPAETPDSRIARAKDRIAAADENLRRHFPDYDSALADLNAAIALVPRHPRAYALLAVLHNRRGDYAKAEEAAIVSLGSHAQNPAAQENLAFARLRLGRVAEAENTAAAAIEEESGRASAHFVRALALEAERRRPEALEELKLAASIEPLRFRERYMAAVKGAKIDQGPGEDPAYLLGGAAPAPQDRKVPWPAIAAVVAILAVGLMAGRRWTHPAKASWRKAAPAVEEKGLLAGRFEMTRVIGQGGWGDVYEALDRSLNRRVAVKKMSDDLAAVDESKGRASLLREARIVASLHHPAIVDIYEIVERGFDIYLIFELVAGKTLERILTEHGRLSLAHAREILAPVCRALSYAHEQGVVHRDLKPSNIMITNQGHVKVMDFGIARVMTDATPSPATLAFHGAKTAATSGLKGTPMYRAPEIERGGMVRREADVFALGCCLYEILCGSAPYGPESMPADKVARRYVPLGSRIPGVPDSVDALIAESLEPDADRRIKTPADFLARLDAASRAAAAATPPRRPGP